MEAKTLEENILMHGQQVATECSVTHWRRSVSGQTWAPATCCGRLAFCCGAGHTHGKLKQNVFFLVFLVSLKCSGKVLTERLVPRRKPEGETETTNDERRTPNVRESTY